MRGFDRCRVPRERSEPDERARRGRCSTAPPYPATRSRRRRGARRGRRARRLQRRRQGSGLARPEGSDLPEDHGSLHAVLLALRRHRDRCHRRHDLRGIAIPREARVRRRRAQAGARQHGAGDLVDDHPRVDPRGHGRVHDPGDLRPERTARGRRRRDRQRDRQAVVLGVRVLRAGHPRMRRHPRRRGTRGREQRRRLRDRQRDAHPGRPADLDPRHLAPRRRHPLVLGPQARRARRTRSRAAITSCSSRRRRPGCSSASAPSTAASRTPTCGCGCSRRPNAEYEGVGRSAASAASRRGIEFATENLVDTVAVLAVPHGRRRRGRGWCRRAQPDPRRRPQHVRRRASTKPRSRTSPTGCTTRRSSSRSGR